MGKPIKSNEMPLYPQVVIALFEKWCLEFFGPIEPPSNGKYYMSVCTHYVTTWVEAKAMRHVCDNKVT